MKKNIYKITLCGHFGGKENFIDGQTIKTQNIYSALLDKYNEKEINKIDTYNWKKHPIKFLMKCVKGIKNSKNIIILPAHNGVKIFIPLFLLINKLYQKKLFYIVIGGWLPEFLKRRNYLFKKVKKLDKIFVETNKMKLELSKLGVDNVEILVNFKRIKPLKENELKFNYSKPYKLCTFSRVMKEKGIEDAIEVVKQINEENNEVIYKLDIYGPIEKSYSQKFAVIINNVPQYIEYKGCVDSDKSVDILKYYYLLLFPTRFKTEGIPGTIIDALAAGVPIIASKWDNVNEMIDDKKNGMIYNFGDREDLKCKLETIIQNNNIINMKKQCLKDSLKYKKEIAIKSLLKELV